MSVTYTIPTDSNATPSMKFLAPSAECAAWNHQLRLWEKRKDNQLQAGLPEPVSDLPVQHTHTHIYIHYTNVYIYIYIYYI